MPQGSHLGPLLFLLFINDIVSLFKYSKCLLFADDLKLFMPIKNVLDCSNLQRDLDLLASWCHCNYFELNINKCKIMSFRRTKVPVLFQYCIDGLPIDRVIEFRDLGILYDEQINFGRHIDAIASKAYSMLGFLTRVCKDFKDPQTLISIYSAHVRSQLEYGSVIWYPNHQVHIDRIESIQKKFLQYVF